MILVSDRSTRPLVVTLLSFILLFGCTFAYGPQSYCCDLTKCRRIVDACKRQDVQADGSQCAKQCPNELDCTSLDSLISKDYSCFGKFLNDTDHAPSNYVCRQSFRDRRPPARRIHITHAECKAHCSGWRQSKLTKPSEWATPLIQFILPAVIFSMTIPRQRKLEAPDGFFNFDITKWTNLLQLLVSLVCAGIIVGVDTLVWVFGIFAGAGPMLVGGIHEAEIDRRIVGLLNSREADPANTSRTLFVSDADKTELLLSVVSGNLDLNIGRVERELKTVISLDSNRTASQKTKSLTSLLNMMASQYSFGSVVGAPVLFYIGAFVYAVIDLSGNQGDNDTAHALAFGMWWVVIVHVSIVSGCLLASNNPSTATAVVAGDMPAATSAIHARVIRAPEAKPSDRFRYFFTTRIYDSPFQPVPMWDRGCMKKCWIERTNVWTAPGSDWFKRKVMIGRAGYFWIGIFSFLLIFAPALLGFIVSYYTPRVCLSCRSLTFLVYTSCQSVLIIVATFRSAFYQNTGAHMDSIWTEVERSFKRAKGENWSLWTVIRVIWLALTAFITLVAVCGSIFTSFAGTLMQIMGVYRNCNCFIPVNTWFRNPDAELINLASDTQEMRDSSKYWKTTGFAAIGFLAAVCYIGWWYQRYLRRRFEERIFDLAR